MHALARGFDPAHQRGVVGKFFDDRPVRGGDVRRIAGQRDPAKRPFALAEQGPDVGGHEPRVVERPRAATKARLSAQAVAVVEDLRAAVEERDHGVDVPGHALARASYVLLGLIEAQFRCVLR